MLWITPASVAQTQTSFHYFSPSPMMDQDFKTSSKNLLAECQSVCNFTIYSSFFVSFFKGQFSSELLFFSCPEQLNRWPCHSLTHWLTDWLTDWLTKDFTNCDTKNDPIDFRLPRYLIRVMRRHVLTYKKTETKTHTTKTPFENLRFWEPTDNRQEPPWPCQHWVK